MKMKLAIAMLIVCVLAGCKSQPPVTYSALVGSYIYKSEDPEDKLSDHQWDHLTLMSDGRYNLIQGGPTKARFEISGRWQFKRGDPAEVALDHSGYPVVVKNSEVRLMIDYDTGIWYSKTDNSGSL